MPGFLFRACPTWLLPSGPGLGWRYAVAYAGDGAARPDSLLDRFPWIPDFAALFAGLGLILLLYYFFRPSRSASGFTIIADEEDITFNGDFPPYMQSTVIDFLRNDCRIPGSYLVRGHWEGNRLIVVVRGGQAEAVEQQIRNFLKLNLKPPRSDQ
jgi:hypothetical protein